MTKNKKILLDLLEKEKVYRDQDKSDSEGNDEEMIQIFLKSKFPCNYCNGSHVYQTAVVRCPICFWHDGNKICPVCERDIPVNERKYSKDGFIRCTDCHAVKHIDPKTFQETNYPPSDEEDFDD